MNNIRKIVREIVEKELNNNEIICYHRSDSYEHMVDGDFSLDLMKDVALFGRAIYFAESSNISPQLGKYLCKFSIKLQEPVLNMNNEISNEEANSLLKDFNEMFNTEIEIDFNEDYNMVQYGEFFGEISELYNWDHNKYYKKFIEHLGFKSFKYFGNYHTDFIIERGDYGLCYGIYNTNDIKFIDGPF